jgi:RNA polymerase sigma factor (sigma-70 family)
MGHPEARNLKVLVEAAQGGDRAALEEVIRRIQNPVYGLALRMLWHPEEARDATQEILIRTVTGLGGFRGNSTFTTWVYRVACNYLKTARRSRLEERRYTFDQFGRELDEGLSDEPLTEGDVEESLLLEEVKIGCTYALLLCLDRDHRLAYILGEILDLEGPEASRILGIEPAAFRKRLSRARADITAFMTAKCGLVNGDAACRCRRRVATAVRVGHVDPLNLRFATNQAHATQFPVVLTAIRRLEGLRRAAALYRSHPEPSSPEDFTQHLRELVAERQPVVKTN